MISGSDAFAQGSIFGSVIGSDLSVPPDPNVVFFGFVNNTDDELRISSSIGAGYENGFWFDDFQNFTSKAPGLPYSYYFFDLATAEGLQFSSLIPNNSFQQEDIQLSPMAWPSPVTGLSVTRTAPSSVQLDWQTIPGFSYHIYRRSALSTGSFFRVDNPSGDLSVAGVIGGQFIDAAAPASDGYDYVLITAADGGLFSPPSEIVTVGVSASCCIGATGNIDNDPNDEVDIADLTFFIDHLFISFVDISCPAEGNVDGDPAGVVDIADLTLLIDHLFISFVPTAACQ